MCEEEDRDESRPGRHECPRHAVASSAEGFVLQLVLDANGAVRAAWIPVDSPKTHAIEHGQRLFDLIEDALGAGAKEFGMTSFLVRRTDQLPEDASIPALTLGLLRADSSHPIDGSGTDS